MSESEKLRFLAGQLLEIWYEGDQQCCVFCQVDGSEDDLEHDPDCAVLVAREVVSGGVLAT